MEPVILRGEPAKLASLFGSGSGYGDGSGYGYGSGSGDGSGYGYGSGYGSGDGDGDGSGDGDGDGSGYGDGYGSGSGDGYGYGDGDGSGDGDGYGYGDGSYWKATIPHLAAKWPANQQSRLSAAVDSGATIAFWRSDKRGLPSNGGGKIEAAAPGVIHTSPGPLQTCHSGTLHATLVPPKWNGERWWIVALHGEVVGDAEKFGCLKREILGEAL